MLGGHELPVAVERVLALARIFPAHLLGIKSQAASEIDQRGLCRVADLHAVRILRVIAEHTADQQAALGRIINIHIRRFDTFLIYIIIFYGHFVLGQGACLVRTDDGNASQSFHSLKFTHDGVFSGHLLRTEGKNDGYNGAQGFRDRRYREGYCEKEGVADIVAPENADAEQDRTEYENKDGQFLSELIQVDLQRRPLLRRRFQQACDLADLGLHTDAGYDKGAAPVCDKAAGVNHVQPVAKRHFVFFNHFGRLLNTEAFTRQCALIHFQACTFGQTSVRRDIIACVQHHDVSDRYF